MSPRRWTLAVAVVLGLAAVPAAQATSITVEAGTDGTRLAVDLTGADLDTTVISPAELAAPEQAVDVGPGTHLVIEIPKEGTFGCTANFVWADGSTNYLGAAGHCFLPPTATATHGTDADYDASGVKVFACVRECTNGGVTGFLVTGELVELGSVDYARQEETKGGKQVGFDFGVAEIPAGVGVRTEMPVFGGPETTGSLRAGDLVCHYGNGVGFGELYPTMGRTAVGLFEYEGAFFFEGLGSFGDSGSAVQTCVTDAEDGLRGDAAIGIFTHLTSIGLAGTTVAQAIDMAADDANLQLSPVLGATGTDTGTGGDDDGGGGNGGGKDRKGPPEGKGPKG